MVFKLQFSRTAQKALDKLPSNAVRKVFTHLEELKRDPYRPRSLADIVPVAGIEKMYRLRVGKLRVEYKVNEEESIIKLLKIFTKKRKSDYR
jgi:mRNA interferase RelE/StbE